MCSVVATQRPADRDQVRAALRLLVPPEQADRLVVDTGVTGQGLDQLETLARNTTRHLQRAHLTARLPSRRTATRAHLPLAAVSRVAPAGAVSYALYLGLGRDSQRLAAGLDAEPDTIGHELATARQALDPAIGRACFRYRSLIGRTGTHIDRSGDLLAFLAHLPLCADCHTALERSRELDQRLVEEVERTALDLSSLGVSRTRRTGIGSRHRQLAGMVLLAIIGIVVSGWVLSQRRGEEHTPIPLLASSGSGSPLDGWLLYTAAERPVEAVHLGTGERRSLPGFANETWRWPMVSPDQQLVAIYASSAANGPVTLEVKTLSGDLVQHLSWDNANAYRFPTGWLDATTLLLAQAPPYVAGESEESFRRRAASLSQLIGLDVRTGTQRVLFQGNVGSTVPSPDGTMVVILAPYDARWPGQTIELRAVDGDQLGPALVTIDRRLVGDVLWAPDSSRFYASVITDPTLAPAVPGGEPGSAAGFERQAVVAIDRAGAEMVLLTPEPRTSVSLLTVSPDGHQLVYGTVPQPVPPTAALSRYPWRYWRLPVAGGTPTLIGDDLGFALPRQVFWTLDGTTMVVRCSVPINGLFLSTTPTMGTDAPMLIAIGPDWQPRLLGLDVTSMAPVALLPTDALPPSMAPSPTPLDGQATDPVPVTLGEHVLQLTADSSVSADRSHILTWDADLERPIILTADTRQTRRLLAGTTDLTWLDPAPAVVGVTPGPVGGPQRGLTFFGAETDPTSTPWYDYQHVDPARLVTDPDRRYARPTLSIGGGVLAFLVVDAQQQTVSVWLAGWRVPAQPVITLPLPADRRLDALPALVWADKHALVVARPDGWTDGLPQQVVFERIDVTADRIPTVTRLTTIDGRRNDRGVVLTELDLSPDRTQVAYRLRHYREVAVDRGRSDSVHVMSVDDVTRAVEVASGAIGEGMAWTPNGGWLAVGLERRIVLLSSDGRRLEYLTPDEARADDPIWVGEHELWFQMESDSSAGAIWSVEVH